MPIFTASNETETVTLANKLAGILRAGDCIALSGTLGAGKTAFARGLIRALAGEVDVTSPTFNLVQIYDATLANGAQLPLWHCDFYRLKSPSEVLELGVEEAMPHAITLIEWPEMAPDAIPADALSINITIHDEQLRQFEYSGNAEWQLRLQAN